MFDPEDVLAQLTARLPLADLVARQTALRRVGQHLRGACPFCCESKTDDSFYVYERHFHCFSCGAHGDHLTFLMHTKNIEIEAAVQEIASEARVEIAEQFVLQLAERIQRWTFLSKP